MASHSRGWSSSLCLGQGDTFTYPVDQSLLKPGISPVFYSTANEQLVWGLEDCCMVKITPQGRQQAQQGTLSMQAHSHWTRSWVIWPWAEMLNLAIRPPRVIWQPKHARHIRLMCWGLLFSEVFTSLLLVIEPEKPDPHTQMIWLKVSNLFIQLEQQICSGRKPPGCSDN